jgi:hypothetical protein
MSGSECDKTYFIIICEAERFFGRVRGSFPKTFKAPEIPGLYA